MTASSDTGALERLLKRDRAVTAAGLVLLCVLAWAYVVTGAGVATSGGPGAAALHLLFPHKAAEVAAPAMAGMPEMAGMPGMGSMASAPAPWSPARWAVVILMWVTMMVAMMTPTAAPALLLYGRVQRHAAAAAQGERLAPTWGFAAGYLLVWGWFATVAALLQWLLEQSGAMSAGGMSSQSRWFSAGVLAAAGVYQLSPAQAACLSHCRSPAAFLSRQWRWGLAGALRLGVLHGAFCVGCCWLLMALLFVGGVMNLVWIAGLAVLVLAQKLVPGGRWIARVTGVVLLAWAAATLVV